jgi:hypothetical protein
VPSLPPPVATGHADLEFVDTPDEPPLELETVVRVQAPASGVPAEPPPATTEPVVREESPAPGRRIPVWAIAAAALLGVGVIVGRGLSSSSDLACPPGSTPGEQVVSDERLVGCRAFGRFEGQVEVRDGRGVLVARRTYVSGEATGPAEEFDASGTVSTGLLRKGLRQGVWLYTRKGKRVEEGAWDGGVAVGPWSRYDPNTAARLETVDRSADAGAAPDAGAQADAGPPVIEVVSSQDLERLYGGHRVSHWRNVLLAADLAGTGALVRTRATRAGLTIAADGGLSP